MKNFVSIVLVGILAFVFLSGSGLADAPHTWTEGKQVPAYVSASELATNAKVFRLKPDYLKECNQQSHSFDVQLRANVAQWARVDVDFTGWSWYVRKPGTFFADSITARIASNGPLTIQLSGFGNLFNEESVNNTVNTWFAYTVCLNGCPELWPAENAWLAPEAVNGPVGVPDSAELHAGLCFKLWNKIEVVECNSAGLYEMETASISVTLDNFTHWADDGCWNDQGMWDSLYSLSQPTAI